MLQGVDTKLPVRRNPAPHPFHAAEGYLTAALRGEQQKVPIRIPTSTSAAYLSASGLFEPDEIEVACIMKLGAFRMPMHRAKLTASSPQRSRDRPFFCRPTRARAFHRQRVQVRSTFRAPHSRHLPVR